MKPNMMQSIVPLHSREKAFVSATASMLTHFRGPLGLLFNQWGSMIPFRTSFWFGMSLYSGNFADIKHDQSQRFLGDVPLRELKKKI